MYGIIGITSSDVGAGLAMLILGIIFGGLMAFSPKQLVGLKDAKKSTENLSDSS